MLGENLQCIQFTIISSGDGSDMYPLIATGPPTQAVLDYKWTSYGRALFVVLAACSATLAGNFSAFTYYSQALAGWRLWAWTAALALNLLPLVLQEAIQVLGCIDTVVIDLRTLSFPWRGRVAWMQRCKARTAF